MGTKKKTQQNLNKVFEQLDGILNRMEEEISLEQSFQLYAEGIQLIKAANESIDKVEKQVKVLDEDGIL